MARGALLVLCLAGLAGCEPVTATLVGANVVTLIHGEKTIPDYLLSSHTKKNCSLLHASRNEEYCQDAPPDQTEALARLAATRYCYRTLGRIDCYDRPDFLASGQTRVNFAAGGYLPDRDEPPPLAMRDRRGLAMSGIAAPAAEAGAKAQPESAGSAGAAETEGETEARALTPASLTPAPSTGPGVVDLAQAPQTRVSPLADLPGQGTY